MELWVEDEKRKQAKQIKKSSLSKTKKKKSVYSILIKFFAFVQKHKKITSKKHRDEPYVT